MLVHVEVLIDNKNRTRDYRIVCTFTNNTPEAYEKLFGSYSLKIARGTQSVTPEKITGNWRLTGNKKNHEKLIGYLLNDLAVKEFDF